MWMFFAERDDVYEGAKVVVGVKSPGHSQHREVEAGEVIKRFVLTLLLLVREGILDTFSLVRRP
jgi:hypothetical protein